MNHLDSLRKNIEVFQPNFFNLDMTGKTLISEAEFRIDYVDAIRKQVIPVLERRFERYISQEADNPNSAKDTETFRQKLLTKALNGRFTEIPNTHKDDSRKQRAEPADKTSSRGDRAHEYSDGYGREHRRADDRQEERPRYPQDRGQTAQDYSTGYEREHRGSSGRRSDDKHQPRREKVYDDGYLADEGIPRTFSTGSRTKVSDGYSGGRGTQRQPVGYGTYENERYGRRQGS